MFSGFIRADLISPDIILLQKYDNWYMTMAFPLIDICKHFQIVRNSHILVGLLTQVSNQSSIMICPDVIPGRPYNSCARHSYTAYHITVFLICKYRASFLRQTMNWYVSFCHFWVLISSNLNIDSHSTSELCLFCYFYVFIWRSPPVRNLIVASALSVM